MTTFSDVFARKEMKYRLKPGQHSRVLAAVEERLELSEFGFSTVRSLSFDTPEYGLIERSLDKPLYKEKLRLRVYGEPADDAQAFVEIKKKFKRIVYKRRVSMTLAAARAYLSGESYERACAANPLADPLAAEQSLSGRSIQIAHEIDFFRERYGRLAPSMLVVCDRSAYADPSGSELRITFDTGISADPNAKALADSCGLAPLIGPGEVIMEIKNAGPLPSWLAAELSAAHAYPQSFSKYGTAYLSLLGGAPLAVRSQVAVSASERGCAVRGAGSSVARLAQEYGKSGRHTGVADVDRGGAVVGRQVGAKAIRGRHARVNERSGTCA